MKFVVGTAGAGAVALMACLLASQPAFSQTTSELRLVSSAQVIEELVHPIRVFAYQPALDAGRARVASGSAEEVVVQWIAAMRRGDYDAVLVFWDESSRAAILERSRVEKVSKDGWVRKWKELFDNHGARLVNQVTFGPAVLIEYEVVDAKQVAVTSEPVVLVRDAAGAYRLTLKYADHAVVQGWKLPNKRVQRLARTN